MKDEKKEEHLTFPLRPRDLPFPTNEACECDGSGDEKRRTKKICVLVKRINESKGSAEAVNEDSHMKTTSSDNSGKKRNKRNKIYLIRKHNSFSGYESGIMTIRNHPQSTVLVDMIRKMGASEEELGELMDHELVGDTDALLNKNECAIESIKHQGRTLPKNYEPKKFGWLNVKCSSNPPTKVESFRNVKRVELQKSWDQKALENWNGWQNKWEAVKKELLFRCRSSLYQAPKQRNNKPERPLLFDHRHNYRLKLERSDLRRLNLAPHEKTSTDHWKMSLRNNNTRYVSVGNIFSGLYCKVQEEGDGNFETIRQNMKIKNLDLNKDVKENTSININSNDGNLTDTVLTKDEINREKALTYLFDKKFEQVVDARVSRKAGFAWQKLDQREADEICVIGRDFEKLSRNVGTSRGKFTLRAQESLEALLQNEHGSKGCDKTVKVEINRSPVIDEDSPAACRIKQPEHGPNFELKVDDVLVLSEATCNDMSGVKINLRMFLEHLDGSNKKSTIKLKNVGSTVLFFKIRPLENDAGSRIVYISQINCLLISNRDEILLPSKEVSVEIETNLNFFKQRKVHQTLLNLMFMLDIKPLPVWLKSRITNKQPIELNVILLLNRNGCLNFLRENLNYRRFLNRKIVTQHMNQLSYEILEQVETIKTWRSLLSSPIPLKTRNTFEELNQLQFSSYLYQEVEQISWSCNLLQYFWLRLNNSLQTYDKDVGDDFCVVEGEFLQNIWQFSQYPSIEATFFQIFETLVKIEATGFSPAYIKTRLLDFLQNLSQHFVIRYVSKLETYFDRFKEDVKVFGVSLVIKKYICKLMKSKVSSHQRSQVSEHFVQKWKHVRNILISSLKTLNDTKSAADNLELKKGKPVEIKGSKPRKGKSKPKDSKSELCQVFFDRFISNLEEFQKEWAGIKHNSRLLALNNFQGCKYLVSFDNIKSNLGPTSDVDKCYYSITSSENTLVVEEAGSFKFTLQKNQNILFLVVLDSEFIDLILDSWRKHQISSFALNLVTKLFEKNQPPHGEELQTTEVSDHENALIANLRDLINELVKTKQGSIAGFEFKASKYMYESLKTFSKQVTRFLYVFNQITGRKYYLMYTGTSTVKPRLFAIELDETGNDLSQIFNKFLLVPVLLGLSQFLNSLKTFRYQHNDNSAGLVATSGNGSFNIVTTRSVFIGFSKLREIFVRSSNTKITLFIRLDEVVRSVNSFKSKSLCREAVNLIKLGQIETIVFLICSHNNAQQDRLLHDYIRCRFFLRDLDLSCADNQFQDTLFNFYWYDKNKVPAQVIRKLQSLVKIWKLAKSFSTRLILKDTHDNARFNVRHNKTDLYLFVGYRWGNRFCESLQWIQQSIKLISDGKTRLLSYVLEKDLEANKWSQECLRQQEIKHNLSIQGIFIDDFHGIND